MVLISAIDDPIVLDGLILMIIMARIVQLKLQVSTAALEVKSTSPLNSMNWLSRAYLRSYCQFNR
jgi:hypothetical protein